MKQSLFLFARAFGALALLIAIGCGGSSDESPLDSFPIDVSIEVTVENNSEFAINVWAEPDSLNLSNKVDPLSTKPYVTPSFHFNDADDFVYVTFRLAVNGQVTNTYVFPVRGGDALAHARLTARWNGVVMTIGNSGTLSSFP